MGFHIHNREKGVTVCKKGSLCAKRGSLCVKKGVAVYIDGVRCVKTHFV